MPACDEQHFKCGQRVSQFVYGCEQGEALIALRWNPVILICSTLNKTISAPNWSAKVATHLLAGASRQAMA
jgi:hypothetical protein